MNDYEKINSKVPTEEYKNNWDKIFGKKLEKESDLEEKTNRKEYLEECKGGCGCRH
jgi:hypothetical protein